MYRLTRWDGSPRAGSMVTRPSAGRTPSPTSPCVSSWSHVLSLVCLSPSNLSKSTNYLPCHEKRAMIPLYVFSTPFKQYFSRTCTLPLTRHNLLECEDFVGHHFHIFSCISPCHVVCTCRMFGTLRAALGMQSACVGQHQKILDSRK